MEKSMPVKAEERAGSLDALRGFALLGICLANSGYFSMYIFKSPKQLASMPFPELDKILTFLHYALVDGKFYSIFSLLFGIGFSIIFYRSSGRGNRLYVFYRRLFLLLVIGTVHAFLIWDGDILMFYALVGMLLPLFRNLGPKTLFWIAAVMILLPIAFDAVKVVTENRVNIGKPFLELALARDKAAGITEANVPDWVILNTRYQDLLNWNRSGVLWSWQMRMEGNRLFKVLGMFLLGLAVGKLRIYVRLDELRPRLIKIMILMFAIGLTAGAAKAYLDNDGKRLPTVEGLLDTIAYSLNVAPLAIAYSIAVGLLHKGSKILRWLEPVGRMALTNYIMQSFICLWIYYGFGLGLATRVGPTAFLPIAVLVFSIQVIYSNIWFKYFEFGPLEWVWRQGTYGERFGIRKVQF